MPRAELDEFVRLLARRIALFPATGHIAVKERVNAVALAPADEFRHDSSLFGVDVVKSEAQNRIREAIKRGFQTRDGEMSLAQMLGDLTDDSSNRLHGDATWNQEI